MDDIKISHRFYEKVLNSLFPKLLVKFLYTIRKPRKGDSSYWDDRAMDDEERGMSRYIELEETSRVLVEEVASRLSSPEAPVLDIACNLGRHLEALRKKGFVNLHGVDTNLNCKDAVPGVFPELSKIANQKWMPIEQYLPEIQDKAFEISFTHGATVEHVPPGFPLVSELARVTSKYIIFACVALEGSTYPRFWRWEFEKAGFHMIIHKQPEKTWAPDSEYNRPRSLIIFARDD